MDMKRKSYTAEFKLKVVLESMQRDMTQELCASRMQRLLKPRMPLDCPTCHLASTPFSGGGPAPLPVRPSCEVKSRRGVPKRIDTQGFACPNQQYPYYGITDAQIHALVGDGKHGHDELIKAFRCRTCRTTFTARRHTPYTA